MISINDFPLNVTIFPDRTSQVWKIDLELDKLHSPAEIKWDFQNEGEFMHLAQLKDLLDRYGKEADLYFDCLPYARQDKQIDNELTFALYTFATLINNLKFRKVIVTDPHSSLDGIIDRVIISYPHSQVKLAFRHTESDVVCYPDHGALEKYSQMYGLEYYYATKERNQLTGEITNIDFNGDCREKKILIVDDICDGGATFKGLAKELYKNGAKEVHLFVSHGLFSKGIEFLREEGIKRIFTKNGEIL